MTIQDGNYVIVNMKRISYKIVNVVGREPAGELDGGNKADLRHSCLKHFVRHRYVNIILDTTLLIFYNILSVIYYNRKNNKYNVY